MAVDGSGRDFFISYAGVNRSWAEWIAVELERAGYSTVVQSFDFRPGADFVHEMQRAVSSAVRTIAVLSPAYFGSRFGEAEWRVAFAKDPSGALGLLLPVRVQPCEPPGLLSTRVYVDLVGADETSARRMLLAAVDQGRARPVAVPWPGGGVGRFPGSGPQVSNLPARNGNFCGRDAVLERLYGVFRAGSVTAVLPVGAVHGLGRVGKTQLAVEFAHRYGSDFDVVWWIPAEQPSAVVAELARLARRLGVPEATDQTDLAAGVLELLRGRDRWLLVYDNAESPADLEGLLPSGGGGQVLVTSRWAAWSALASPLPLDVLARQESVEFLRRRAGSAVAEVGWSELAALVGDLPLALEEAAAYLEETGESLPDYLELLRSRARELFGLDRPGDGGGGADERDRRRVATVWSVSLDRVSVEAPAAGALLNLLAFLAPEVPRTLPAEQPQALPDPLGTAVGDRLTYNRLVAAIGRYSLATVSGGELRLHRLVQAVIHARLGPAGERTWAATAVEVIRAAFPADSWEVARWPECERLLPHLLAVTAHAQRLGVAGEDAGWLLDRASTYLRERGQYRQARPLAEQAVTVTETALGADHADVAWRRDELGSVLQALGDLAGARDQFELALRIGEAALAPDDHDVGIWRGNLGSVLQALGDLTGARNQYEQALRITEAAHGPDHPHVGTWHSSLGSVLQALGDLTGARDQLEQALRIGEAALAPDHPDVGIWRGNLGSVLQDLGDLAGARDQLEQALHITEAAHGPDHPHVGIRRSRLGSVLQDLGDLTGARDQLEQALHISEATLGPDHPQVRTIRINLDRLTPPQDQPSTQPPPEDDP
ncbi:FxSxx-COOH system tetratricopeptide repeat protein [Dactylosporangium sp. NPDC049525]|uniref:FxSxx-COOH system tetratricopeptide repeat protein n=1 Tax=Dactylosporangium sp. NPDC049525 TaxID=3154730 RepID=UPI003440E9DD